MNYALNLDDVEKLEGSDEDIFRAYYTDAEEAHLMTVPTELIASLREHNNVMFVHLDMMNLINRFLDKSTIRTFTTDDVLEEIGNITKEGYSVLVYSFYYVYKIHVKLILVDSDYLAPSFRKCIISDTLDNV